jgi:hypothetical protein
MDKVQKYNSFNTKFQDTVVSETSVHSTSEVSFLGDDFRKFKIPRFIWPAMA